jgi:hypothetical protein
MPLKRLLNESGSFDPNAIAILLKAYDGVVNELGLGAPPEKERAPNSLFGSRKVKQTLMLQSSAMTPSR